MASPVTLWDARLLFRAAFAGALVLGLAVLVTAATDEGGVPWAERAARSLPLTPACAAIGAWIALAPARARGETLALQALGRSRIQIAGGAVAGGALVVVGAALAIVAVRTVDVGAFYPRAAGTAAWTWRGDAFENRAQGLRVDREGVPTLQPADPEAAVSGVPPRGRASAAAATVTTGVALALLVAHATIGVARSDADRRGRRRARFITTIAIVGALAAALVLFQAAAAGHVPAVLAVGPPLALLAFAVERYRARP